MACDMATYECVFFRGGVVDYWENVEAETEGALRTMLRSWVLREGWDSAEAWQNDVLIFRIGRTST